MEVGYVIMPRNILDIDIFKTKDPCTWKEAYQDMIMFACYEDKTIVFKNEPIELKRGQFAYSINTMSEKFRWSIQSTRTFLKCLEKKCLIKCEGLKYLTRVTICNYDNYRDDQQTVNKLTTNCQQTDNKLPTTYKLSNKIINEVNNNNELFEPANPAKPKKAPKPKAEKKVYGSFGNVMLSDEEYKKLSDRFTEETTKSAIEIYSTWKEKSQANRKSDYSGLLANDAWPFQRASEKNKAKISASDQALTRQQQKINNQASIEDWKVYKSL